MSTVESQEERSLFERNLSIIEERWPSVHQELLQEGLQSERLVEMLTELPQPTVKVAGIHLTSGYDRIHDARLQAEAIPEESSEAWVYGCGLGDLPRLLLERERLTRITVVVLNPDVVFRTLSHVDHGDWLSDSRISLCTVTESGPVVQRPFAASTACLKLAGNSRNGERLAANVLLELSTPFLNRDFTQAELMRERVRSNRPFVQRDRDAAELFGTFPSEKVAVVAGAGPTLSEHLDTLYHNRHRFVIIAVDAVLSTLIHAGIRPDYVITIDPYPMVLTLFETNLEGFEETPLIYFPTVDPTVLNHWPGPRFVARSHSPLHDLLEADSPDGVLFASGLVIHPALDLAVKMGAEKVVLTGADFGFPNHESHASGSRVRRTVHQDRISLTVTNGNGEEFATITSYRNGLLDCERYIAGLSKTTVIQGSRRSARIDGCSALDETELHTLWDGKNRPHLKMERGYKKYLTDERNSDPTSSAWALLENGRTAMEKGDNPLDISEMFQAARHLFFHTHDQRGEMWSWKALADAALNDDDPDQALGCLEHVMTALESVPDHQLRAEALLCKGLSMLRSEATRSPDESMTAVKHLEEAMHIFRGMDAPVWEARCRRASARYYEQVGRFEDAVTQVRSALVILEQASALTDQGRCHDRLGELLVRLNRFDEAEQSILQAIAIHRQTGNRYAEAMSRNAQFSIQLEHGRPEQGDSSPNCLTILVKTARCFRQGLEAKGHDMLTRLIDCLLSGIREGALVVTPEQVTPALHALAQAQKSGDLLLVADILEFSIGPTWFNANRPQ
ncbi:MAG: DUF115 domain-containing protein [Magnetococcales bacterium]|nr:DUF115 domain-containing protein [Magnetococcales bacterium]